MNKGKWALINIAVAIALVLLTLLGRFIIGAVIDSDRAAAKYRFSAENIDFVEFCVDEQMQAITGLRQPSHLIKVEDRDAIGLFVQCLGEAEENTKHIDNEIMAEPRDYTFSISVDRIVQEYEYRISYDNRTHEMNDPFEKFFEHPAVREQISLEQEKDGLH